MTGSTQYLPVLIAGGNLPLSPASADRLVVRIVDRAAPSTTIATLDSSFGRTFQDRLNDAGLGAFTIANGDTDAASLDYGLLARFEVDGLSRFQAVLEHKDRVTLDPGEEAEENTRWSGRGTVALWEDMVVHPANPLDSQPFTDSRTFSFASPEFDDTGWDTTVTEYDPVPEAPSLDSPPEGWPEPDAFRWIWDKDEDITQNGVPAGDCYFRNTFTLDADKRVAVFAAADDAYDVYIDGILVLTDPGWYRGQFRTTTLTLSDDTHTVAAKGVNQNALQAGFAMTILEEGAQPGSYGDVVLRTNGSSGWKCLPYPSSPPGFTPGEILRILLDEAQARGAMSGWTLGFTDATDTDGQAWPTTTGEVTFMHGLDGLSALFQLAETWIDFAAPPTGLRLDAWNAGGRGGASGVTLAAGSNLLALAHTGDG